MGPIVVNVTLQLRVAARPNVQNIEAFQLLCSHILTNSCRRQKSQLPCNQANPNSFSKKPEGTGIPDAETSGGEPAWLEGGCPLARRILYIGI